MRTGAAEPCQVSETLLIEINSFATPEPSSTMPIATLIRDFLVDAGRTDLVRHHELDPFSVRVLCVERTLCEKVMLAPGCPPLGEATIVADAEGLWRQVRPQFRGGFRDMVHGDSLPEEAGVLACLAAIGSSLTRI